MDLNLRLISLDRTPDRLARFKARNPQYADMTRIPAIDGALIDREELVAGNMLEAGLPYTDGAIGCALSHITQWAAVIQADRPATLLEDDAILCANFEQEAARVIAELPADWEFVFWGYNMDSFVMFDMLPGVSPCSARFNQLAVQRALDDFHDMPVNTRLFRILRCFGTPAYTISPRGARRLLAFCVPLRPMDTFYPGLERTLPNTGIDNMMAHAFPALNGYIAIPPLVVTDNDVANSTVQPTLSLPSATLLSTQPIAATKPAFQTGAAPASGAPVCEAEIIGRAWRFHQPDGRILAPRLRFLPGGRVGGYRSPAAQRWQIQGGQLRLIDQFGRVSLRLTRATVGETGTVLAGLSSDGQALLLTEHPTPLPQTKTLNPTVLRPAASRRRNLVILRANEESIHEQWAADIDDADRNWDLCISYYGKADGFAQIADAEYTAYQPDDRKFMALHKLLHADSPFWRYDYFMFPDDDVAMRRSDINRCFELADEYGLDLAQPALTTDHAPGYFSHEITRARPGSRLRYTSFVEVMMPVFSRYALQVCLPSFTESHSGWGLDYAWTAMLGFPRNRIAVIDEIAVRHTRAVGTNYGGLDPQGDLDRLMADYGGTMKHTEYGLIGLD